jgi:hypothetical protein
MFFISLIVFQLISLNRNFYFKYKRSFGGNFNFNTRYFYKFCWQSNHKKSSIFYKKLKETTRKSNSAKENYHNKSHKFEKN